MVTVIIPSMMQPFTDHQTQVTVEGNNLRQVITQLVTRYPQLKERIFDEDDQVHSHIAFFVNGVEAPGGRGLFMPVPPGAEVVIVPALSGG